MAKRVTIEDADPEMVEFTEMEDMMGAFSIQLRLWAENTKNVELNKARVHMREIVSLISEIGDKRRLIGYDKEIE